MGKIDFDIITEAFKAGNRSRKKESAQDSVESVDSLQAQIDLFKEQTGIELEIRDGKPCYGTDLYLIGCTGLTSLPAGLEVDGDLFLNNCTGLTRLPVGLKVRGSLYLGCTGLTSLPFDLVVQGDWIMHRSILTPFFRKLGIPVDEDGDTLAEDWSKWQKAHRYINEAFKTGNRARKKESVQDTVESVDDTQAQIKLFKKQTGKKLKIRDGHPYFDKYLILRGCTRLTSLPTGLEVRGDLDLQGCTGLTSLPADLKVGGYLFLQGCTGLTSLPAGLAVGGCLYLDGCTRLTKLPFDLVVQGVWITHKGILTPFFRKLGIPVDDDGVTLAKNWRNWQKAHGYLKEAFKAGNRARKKEAAQDTVETFEDMVFPTVMRSPVNLIADLVGFLHRLGYKVTDECELRDAHHMQNDNPIYYFSENLGNSLYGGYIRISLGRHPVWNERLRRFISTGLILCIEALDRMYYRVQFLSADKEIEESVQFLNCSSKWFEAWEKPDGTRYGNPRNEAALTDNSIPAVWPNLFRNILTAARHPEYVFVPDKTYTKCWLFEKPSDIDEAFKAGNQSRKKESAIDTVESVNDIQAQIDLFKEQTGIELEIRDGRPYYNRDLEISGRLVTSLPQELFVNGYLNLEYCTKLRKLPDGLTVKDWLNLQGYTRLTKLPDRLTVGCDLYLKGCTGLTSLPSDLNIKRGYIYDIPDSLKPFIKKLGIETDKFGDIRIRDYREKLFKMAGQIDEAFRAGNRSRKKESAQNTTETLDDWNFPTTIANPDLFIVKIVEFLNKIGYEKDDYAQFMYISDSRNFDLKYYYNTNNSLKVIRISLGRHPVWNEIQERFIDTGLILSIEADNDRMYYRINILSADDEKSVQFLNCSSEWFDAWETPSGVRWGSPRCPAGLEDNRPAVWPNLFRNILTAARHPEYVFMPDMPTYTRCWSFKKPSEIDKAFKKPSEIDEAFRAGNRSRKKESVQDTVQETGHYKPITRELFKDVTDSVVDPEEMPISGKMYRRYNLYMSGKTLANCLNRILELCGYGNIAEAEVVFEDSSCDGVQIVSKDDLRKNYSISRFAVEYSRDFIRILTGSMDSGMSVLLYVYKDLPNILEIHQEGIDTINADLREYIDKFG